MNPYTVLNVAKNASDKDIKTQFRNLSKQYHPDINKSPEAESKFKEIAAAYQILSDKQKRQHYDTYGTVDNINSRHSAAAARSFHASFAEIFGQGFGFRPSQNTRGQDVQTDIQLTLEQAFFGCTLGFKYIGAVLCECMKSQDLQKCPVCKGKGSIAAGNNFFQIQQVCRHCRGRGKIRTKACKICNNTLLVKVPQEMQMAIPPGTRPGEKLIAARKGLPCTESENGQNGDLIIKIKIMPHNIFQLEGNNLKITKEINILDLITKSEFYVPLLEGGDTAITIDSNVDLTKSIVVSQKGFKAARSNNRGNLLVNIKPITPNITNEQKNAIKKIIKGVES